MADAIALPQPRAVSAPGRILALIPGILLLATVGYAGQFLEQFIARYGKAHHLVLPNIEYVLWAILIGLAISNTIGVPALFRAGVATYEFWLKAGIVLLGGRFLIGDVLRLGSISLVLVFIEIALSLTFMTFLGRAFKLRPKLITLLAVGSSICGVSAIIATQGAIDADEEDSSYAIAAILALGAISLFLFPLIGHGLHLSDHGYGLWAGLAVDNTAEASAAGALYSDAAGKVAAGAKWRKGEKAPLERNGGRQCRALVTARRGPDLHQHRLAFRHGSRPRKKSSVGFPDIDECGIQAPVDREDAPQHHISGRQKPPVDEKFQRPTGRQDSDAPLARRMGNDDLVRTDHAPAHATVRMFRAGQGRPHWNRIRRGIGQKRRHVPGWRSLRPCPAILRKRDRPPPRPGPEL